MEGCAHGRENSGCYLSTDGEAGKQYNAEKETYCRKLEEQKNEYEAQLAIHRKMENVLIVSLCTLTEQMEKQTVASDVYTAEIRELEEKHSKEVDKLNNEVKESVVKPMSKEKVCKGLHRAV